MKTKNRLLLSAALLLGLTAVSATTATYAWFVTGLNSSATVSNIVAQGDGSLTVTYTNIAGLTEEATEDSTGTFKAAPITDVTSNNGVDFKKASFDSTGAVDSLKAVPTDNDYKYTTTAYYLLSFKAEITIPNATKNYAIFLGDGASTNKMINSTDTGTNSMNSSLRVSTTTAATGSATAVSGTTIYGNIASFKYTDPDKTNKAITASESLKTVNTSTSITELTSYSADNCTLDKGYLGKITTAENDKLTTTFNIWLEGAETPSTVFASTIKGNLNFYIYALEINA